jgi:hypothetical protein
VKPRPFYRWKSFWLGLCVLVFLGWAWVDSVTRWSEASFRRCDSYVVLASSGGKILVFWYEDPNNTGEFFVDAYPLDAGPWLPKALTWVDFLKGWEMDVAHWLLVLLFLVPWCAWLFFHWKREQKKLTA